MDKPVLCVGLVCLDITAETENFPIEDTDQRFLFSRLKGIFFLINAVLLPLFLMQNT